MHARAIPKRQNASNAKTHPCALRLGFIASKRFLSRPFVQQMQSHLAYTHQHRLHIARITHSFGSCQPCSGTGLFN